jgi:two-component system C4-dicarboxylate transport response regulator DctD
MPNRPPPLVLIAADDQAVCDALQFALRLEGLSVRTHRDAAALLQDEALVNASCIIVDDRKPHVDGIELAIRLQVQTFRMPVILLSSNPSRRLRARAANARIQVILEKPLLDNVLLDSIRAILAPGAVGVGSRTRKT